MVLGELVGRARGAAEGERIGAVELSGIQDPLNESKRAGEARREVVRRAQREAVLQDLLAAVADFAQSRVRDLVLAVQAVDVVEGVVPEQLGLGSPGNGSPVHEVVQSRSRRTHAIS
jgi:hypothetical protein